MIHMACDPLRDQPNNDYMRVGGETAYCVCDLSPGETSKSQ